MAIGTLLTGVFVFVSTAAPNTGAFLTFLCLEALFQNIMYGVLYAYTPESFPAPVRGTGDGIASRYVPLPPLPPRTLLTLTLLTTKV
jgi:hypothetical protein